MKILLWVIIDGRLGSGIALSVASFWKIDTRLYVSAVVAHNGI